jgi:hypothetical protein
MFSSQKLSVWQARLESLNEAIDAIPGTSHSPRQSTIEALSGCLQSFGQRQFDFFVDGFFHHKEFILDPSQQYPVDNVLQTTLLQMAYDIDVLRRAAAQRDSGDGSLEQAFAVADNPAQRALEPAIQHGYLSDTAVLTYSQKSADIRVIPYAPVALIGIPETCTHVNWDLLAIPHEAGHYVFRHGRHPDGESLVSRSRRAVAAEPRWLKKWLEEIFADVYGCLVAGPVLALDFQDLLLDNALDYFLRDDGEHPVDFLRPYIHTHVLRLMGFNNAAAKLDDRWRYWLKQRGNPAEFELHEAEDGTTIIRRKKARARLKTAVKKMAKVLAPIFEEGKADDGLPWTRDVDADADLAQREDIGQTDGPLYGQFEAFLADMPADISDELRELKADPDNDEMIGVAHGKKVRDLRPRGSTGLWLDLINQHDERPTQFPPEVWTQVLSAGGWATKGPENEWP